MDRLGRFYLLDEKSPTRPLIKLIDTEEILNLEKIRQLYIEEIIITIRYLILTTFRL